MKIDVLNNGYVRLLSADGSDLDAVNAARVSYDVKKTEFDEKKDARLLNFLGREDHTSPFRHNFLRFEVYAPLMVARQWWKYIIGSDHADQPERNADPFTAHNESSRRYITENVEFYVPGAHEWRSAPENSKQGSGNPLNTYAGLTLTEDLIQTQLEGLERYEKAIAAGVAVEQARLFLPAYGLMVRWRWAASLQGVSHFLYQRLQNDSQYEIQKYAQAVDKLSRFHYPNAIAAYVDQKLQNEAILKQARAMGLTGYDEKA